MYAWAQMLVCADTPLHLIKQTLYCSHKTGATTVVTPRVIECETRCFAFSPGTDAEAVTEHLHKHHLLLTSH